MTESPSGMSHVTTAEFAFSALMVTLTGGDKLSANRQRGERSESWFYHLWCEANESDCRNGHQYDRKPNSVVWINGSAESIMYDGINDRETQQRTSLCVTVSADSTVRLMPINLRQNQSHAYRNWSKTTMCNFWELIELQHKTETQSRRRIKGWCCVMSKLVASHRYATCHTGVDAWLVRTFEVISICFPVVFCGSVSSTLT